MSEESRRYNCWQYVVHPSLEAHEIICALCGGLTVKYFCSLSFDGLQKLRCMNALGLGPGHPDYNALYRISPCMICPTCFEYHFDDIVLTETRKIFDSIFSNVSATMNFACGYGKNSRKIPEN